MEMISLLLLSILPALAIAAGLSDLTTMRIPNWLSAALVLTFFPAALAVGLPLQVVGIHVAVAFAALLAGMLLFGFRVIGGGDAKLMAATCLWLGVAGSLHFLVWTGLFGGVLSLALIVARKDIAPHFAGAPHWVETLMEPRGDIPYGVAIAAGALMAFPASGLLTAFIAG